MQSVPVRLDRWAQRCVLALLCGGLLIFPAAFLIAETATGRALVARLNPPESVSNPLLERERTLQPLIDQSLALLSAKRPLEALELLRPAARVEGAGVAVFNNLCVAHGMLGQRAEAVAACERAVALDPLHQLAINNLAWVRGLPAR